MALFRSSKPNVKALGRRGDEDGLVAAAGYQNLIPGPEGRTIDRGAEIRHEAILALSALGSEAGVDAVRAALSDRSERVRVTAIQVLYAREEAAPLAAALAWLPKDPGHARGLAMRALAELRRPESAPVLVAAVLQAPGDDSIGSAEARLLKLLLEADEGFDAAGDVVEALLAALADERDSVCDRAEELLALTAPVSIEGVLAELKAGAAPHRAAAVLARIKDTRALEPLMEALLHRDASVRAESAAALGELRDPAAVEALIHATRDSDHRVRASAGAALDQLGMVALVVGVSTMVRPAILEAIASTEIRPGLPKGDNGSSGNGNRTAADDDEPLAGPSGLEALERALAALEGSGEPTDEPS